MATVLVVDDEQSIVDLLVEIVTDAGHSALTASNGRDALRLAEQHQPPLIISDVMMPLMDGYALLQALRADPALAHTMVILISAAAVQSQRASSATAFLRKPIDLEVIDTFLQSLPA
jgi:CheY-like chemotaxis protein